MLLARAAAGELHECCCWWSWRVRRAVQACALHDGMPLTCKVCGVRAKRRSPTTSVTCRTMRGHLACLPACDSLLSTLCTRAAPIQPPACLCTLCTAPPLYSLRGALHHVSHSPLTRCIVMTTLTWGASYACETCIGRDSNVAWTAPRTPVELRLGQRGHVCRLPLTS